MTETEQWVNVTCERIMTSGHVRLYRDVYKDLRGRMPCHVACRLLTLALERTRSAYLPDGGPAIWQWICDRARAIAALRRLRRWAQMREAGVCRDCGALVAASFGMPTLCGSCEIARWRHGL